MQRGILSVFLLKCVYALSGHQHYGFRLILSKPHIVEINKNRRIKYIIDIDGTICNKTDSDYLKCKPRKDKINLLNRLYDSGHEVHYWTARGANSGKNWDDLTIEQLDSWNVKYNTINMGKPHYDVWIDDKAINVEDFK